MWSEANKIFRYQLGSHKLKWQKGRGLTSPEQSALDTSLLRLEIRGEALSNFLVGIVGTAKTNGKMEIRWTWLWEATAGKGSEIKE